MEIHILCQLMMPTKMMINLRFRHHLISNEVNLEHLVRNRMKQSNNIYVNHIHHDQLSKLLALVETKSKKKKVS